MSKSENQKTPPVAPVHPKRRRLLGGGAAATVIASLKSGSALAEGVCLGPSAFTSVTLNPGTSNKPQQFQVCHSHGYWKNHAWPISRDTTVMAAFGLGLPPNDANFTGSSTLWAVLNWEGGGGKAAFARDLISAYLDARSGVSAFDVNDVKGMWGLVFFGQPYTLKTGVVWNDPGVVRRYLDVLVGTGANPYN